MQDSTKQAQGAQSRRTYHGCVHVHSNYSDGGGSVEDIMDAARQASVDFVVLADHNNLGALRDGCEGWYGDALLLVGVEMSTRAGHYLAFGVPPDFKWVRADVQGSIDAVNAAGGFGIISHPTARWGWKDLDATGYAGMELSNLNSLIDRAFCRNPLVLLFDLLVGGVRRAICRVVSCRDGCADAWAKALDVRRCVGIGGTDAHGLAKLGPARVRVPSYLDMFCTLQVTISVPEDFTRDLAHDRSLVYNALREGRFYTTFTAWGNASDFTFSAIQRGTKAFAGDTLDLSAGAITVETAVPGSSEIECRIYRGSRLIHSAPKCGASLDVNEPGAYRVEVHRKAGRRLVPWIYSNAIYVE